MRTSECVLYAHVQETFITTPSCAKLVFKFLNAVTGVGYKKYRFLVKTASVDRKIFCAIHIYEFNAFYQGHQGHISTITIFCLLHVSKYDQFWKAMKPSEQANCLQYKCLLKDAHRLIRELNNLNQWKSTVFNPPSVTFHTLMVSSFEQVRKDPGGRAACLLSSTSG